MANLTNINNKFLVTTGGNVGIGTTSPLYKLNVEDTAADIFYGATDATSGSMFRLRSNNKATTIFDINATGLVDIGNYVQLFDYAAGAVVANRAGYLKLESQAKTGWAPNDEHGKIEFYGQDTSGVGARNAASIRAVNENGNGSTTTTFSGALAFYTSAYNSVLEMHHQIPH